MDNDRRIQISEFIGGSVVFISALYWAYNLDAKPTQPNELLDRVDASSETQDGSTYNRLYNINPDQRLPQANIPEYTNGYITRNNPRSRFLISEDPKNMNRQCASKTNESPANTLVGMTIVLGDKDKYDGKGIIYDGNGNQIGVWDSGVKVIGFEDLSSPAYIDAVACLDN